MTATTSQCDAILRVLKSRPNRWVSLGILARESGSLSPATRISNLRERGHSISNRTEKATRKGVTITKSFYRLNS